ncbi:hypothetical protein BC833DRAFT_649255 [Globomyces pollinis-pini]|nr:hypothetical protein BC833DRAFT_649255 [Globomyces pollinis-pini]
MNSLKSFVADCRVSKTVQLQPKADLPVEYHFWTNPHLKTAQLVDEQSVLSYSDSDSPPQMDGYGYNSQSSQPFFSFQNPNVLSPDMNQSYHYLSSNHSDDDRYSQYHPASKNSSEQQMKRSYPPSNQVSPTFPINEQNPLNYLSGTYITNQIPLASQSKLFFNDFQINDVDDYISEQSTHDTQQSCTVNEIQSQSDESSIYSDYASIQSLSKQSLQTKSARLPFQSPILESANWSYNVHADHSQMIPQHPDTLSIRHQSLNQLNQNHIHHSPQSVPDLSTLLIQRETEYDQPISPSQAQSSRSNFVEDTIRFINDGL